LLLAAEQRIYRIAALPVFRNDDNSDHQMKSKSTVNYGGIVMSRLFWLLIFVTGLASVATAGPYEDGLAARSIMPITWQRLDFSGRRRIKETFRRNIISV